MDHWPHTYSTVQYSSVCCARLGCGLVSLLRAVVKTSTFKMAPSLRPSGHGRGLPWNRKASTAWWRAALQHPEPEFKDEVYYNVHPLTQLVWHEWTLPPPPQSLRTSAQVIGRFSDSDSADLGVYIESRPSLLRFPGPGVLNSAARTIAMDNIDWQQVYTTAQALERGDADPAMVIDVLPMTHGWQVVSNLEYVLAKALVDQTVVARPSGSPVRQRSSVGQHSGFDPSKLYAVWRRAELECPHPSAAAPTDGWHRLQADGGVAVDDAEVVRLLDPSMVMSSRDLEPIIWPKAWHFATKLGALSDNAARAACFGKVPVRWVPQTHRWMTGNRHRLIAALLLGQPMAATPVSANLPSAMREWLPAS